MPLPSPATLLLLTTLVDAKLLSLRCESHSEQDISVPVHGPTDQFVFNFRDVPRKDRSINRNLAHDQYNSDHVKCKWTFHPLHGSRVEVRYITADFPVSTCAGSQLRIYNEQHSSGASALNYPGHRAACGESDFPGVISSKGALTLEFETTNPADISYYVDIIGTLPSSCPAKETQWSGCPDGPCCQGENCCTVELGTDPVDITSTARYQFGEGTGTPGQDCNYRLETVPGAQVMVNFKEMDMVGKSDTIGCNQQAVTLNDKNLGHHLAPHSLLEANTSFCGKQVPNYPGPSALTSSANSLDIRYTTHTEKMQRGRGFKAAVSAINPLCAALELHLEYGHTACESKCGVPPMPVPTTIRPATCPDPKLKVKVLSADTGLPISGAEVTMVTQNPEDVSKIRSVTRKTAIAGLVQDSRFTKEEIKIIAHAPGYEAFTKMINFTCEADKCVNCVWKESIELSTAPPNITSCRDVPAKVTFTDSVSQEGIPDVTFDMYMLPLLCPIPEELSTGSGTGSGSGSGSVTGSGTGSGTTAGPETAATSGTPATSGTTEAPVPEAPVPKAPVPEAPVPEAPAPGPVSRNSEVTDGSAEATDTTLFERMLSLFMDRDGSGTGIGNGTTTDTGPGLRELQVMDRSEPICNLTRVAKDLVTDSHGAAAFLVESSAQYLVRSVRHAYYQHPIPVPVASLNCSLDACDTCNLTMSVGLMLPSCTTAKLHVHVWANGTDEAVVGAMVDIFLLDEKLNSEPLVTGDDGEVELEVPDKGTFRVNVTSEGMESMERMASTDCDQKNCSACATVVKFHTNPITKPQACPNSTLSLSVIDLASEISPPSLAISMSFSEGPSCDLDSLLIKNKYLRMDFAIMFMTLARLNLGEFKECRKSCREHKNCFFFQFVYRNCELYPRSVEAYLYGDSTPGNQVSGPAYCPIGGDPAPAQCKEDNNKCTSGATIMVADRVPSLKNHIIHQNGLYNIDLSAPGYEATSKEVKFNCTPGSCQNCSQTYNLNLAQVFCEETHFDVSVTDSGQPVADSLVKLLRGFEVVDAKNTSSNGKVSFPVDGKASFTVNISKDGYEDLTQKTDVFCKLGLPCSECKPELQVELIEVFCNKSVKLSVSAMAANGTSIKASWVKLSLRKTEAGIVGKDFTEISNRYHNESESWEELITQFGTYSVQLTAEGFLPASTNVEVNELEACIHHKVPVNMTLEPAVEPFPCENSIDTKITIKVEDKLTITTLAGAKVVMKHEGVLLLDDITDKEGKVQLTPEANGEYEATVSAPGYTSETITLTLLCAENNCGECGKLETVRLDQPRCKDVAFPVTVSDFHNHEKPISNAIVELIQLFTLAGESNVVLDTKHTDNQGLATFTIQMNGKYLVKVSADGYIPGDEELVLNCTEHHCDACNPALKPQLKEQFCENKNLTLIISDAVKNEGVEGASITMWIDVKSERDGESSYTTDSQGQVVVPLRANGKYNFEISHPKYITLGREFEIDVQPGLCNAYHPVDLSPFSPKLPSECDDGIRASLSWGEEPSDLDFFSYRVNNGDVNDACLTYYCDGKDPCSGITHDVDNKNGGLNGSETITFCNTEDFVHMIYVDEVSGRGSSLASSKAKLVFQSNHQSVEVHLKTDTTKAKRYWLAGCLLLQNGGFTFLEVNKFFTDQPSVEKPNFCYDEIQLRRKAVEAQSETEGDLTVEVRAEDAALAKATVELRTPSGLSHYRSTATDGKAKFSVLQEGEYAVLVRARGYYPAVERTTVQCGESAVHCKRHVLLQLVRIRGDGAIRLNLAWESDQLDLNLHTVQVDRQETAVHCETYYNQPSTCMGVEFGREGEGETITILAAAERPTLTYLVFIEDHSPTPALNMSQARLSLSDGDTEKVHPMPAYRAQPGDTYWFAGCLAVYGDSFLFLEMDRFSRSSPVDSQHLTCVGLLKGKENMPLQPAFCSGVNLEVNVVDSLNNQPLSSQLGVVRRQGETEETIHVQHSSYSEFSIPIGANGVYHIEADSESYTQGHAEVLVACELSRCSACRPSVVLPMVGGLGLGKARLAVSWRELDGDNDADLYVVQRKVRVADWSCVGSHGPGSEQCPGVRHLVSAHGHASKNRFESIELSGGTPGHHHYYMIVVDLQSHSEMQREGDVHPPSQCVHLVITDYEGEEVRVKMDMKTFRKDRYWVVGCLGGEYMSSASFSEVNMFLDSPPEAEEDYCRDFLETGLKDCFSGARGPSYEVADTEAALPVATKATMKKCADYCTLTPSCQAWEWDSSYKSCQLYTGGRLSGRLPGGTRTYAGVCPQLVEQEEADAGAVVVLGGDGGLNTAEVWTPSGGTACTLPFLLPENMPYNPSVQFTGGNITTCYGKKCWQLQKTDDWKQSATTKQRRILHQSAVLPDGGVLLMGGSGTGSDTSMEIIGPLAKPEKALFFLFKKSFPLRNTRSDFCAIQTGEDSVVLTGGQLSGAPWNSGKVTEYSGLSSQGPAPASRELPALQETRYRHACGMYQDGGKQVLIVAGGEGPTKDSVEILNYSPLGTQWTFTTHLPTKRSAFSGITLGNVFYVVAGEPGGWRAGREFLKTVVAWRPDTKTWEEEGSLATGRRHAGIAAIPSSSAAELCNTV